MLGWNPQNQPNKIGMTNEIVNPIIKHLYGNRNCCPCEQHLLTCCTVIYFIFWCLTCCNSFSRYRPILMEGKEKEEERRYFACFSDLLVEYFSDAFQQCQWSLLVMKALRILISFMQAID